MADKLEQGIKELIAGITGIDINEIKPEANFWNDLGIDSIKSIEMVVALERKYQIRIREDQIPTVSTLSQAVAVVKELLAKKAQPV